MEISTSFRRLHINVTLQLPFASWFGENGKLTKHYEIFEQNCAFFSKFIFS